MHNNYMYRIKPFFFRKFIEGGQPQTLIKYGELM